ncbi:MAG: AAA family ATPase [Zoogloeaceae bacterium]|jgi:DNA sulfur modification protein DndD|nr:AAA family ATPase [Zoogloeaceae bacterium]
MKFVSVNIENLFSYREGYFEFPMDKDPALNVILIHGRNGFGKTSFINAMKLLFLGPHPELTHNVRPSHKLRPVDYLLGSGQDWEGAFNRNARRDNKDKCGVTLRWREKNGHVTATRSWVVDWHLRKYEETLCVKPEFKHDENELQTTEQKEEFLERRLPKNLLPFFIYDAEQVQRIAESNATGTTEHIERLLDITTTRIAEDALDRVLKKFRSAGIARKEQIKLDELNNECERLRIESARFEAEISEKEGKINEHKYRIQQLEERIERTRDISKRSEFELRQASEDLRNSRSSLEEESFSFLDSFPAIAPFVAHTGKLQKARDQIETLLRSNKSELVHELEDILAHLPHRLFDEPQHPRPPLEGGQIRFLKTKLGSLLQAEINQANASVDRCWQLDIERSRRLAQTLRQLLSLNNRDVSQQLNKISQIKSAIKRAEDTLTDISTLPEDERSRIENFLVDKAKLEAENDKLRELIGALRQNSKNASSSIAKVRTEIHMQEKVVVAASRNQIGVDLTENLIHAIRDYRDRLREQRREDIQVVVNKRFTQLMKAHGLIHEIRFEKDFRFGYFDEQGRPVGMANISAGMKQLAAQALLWGLKDLAAQDFPIIIDTPLARIDAAHQRHLISDYYPSAGGQVIVLPTDSELNREKYALLKPHIACEIRLNNPTGEDTHVEIGKPMFTGG